VRSRSCGAAGADQLSEWQWGTVREDYSETPAVGARSGMTMREILPAAPFRPGFDTATLKKRFAFAFAIRRRLVRI